MASKSESEAKSRHRLRYGHGHGDGDGHSTPMGTASGGATGGTPQAETQTGIPEGGAESLPLPGTESETPPSEVGVNLDLNPNPNNHNPNLNPNLNLSQVRTRTRGRGRGEAILSTENKWWKIHPFRGMVNDLRRRAPYYASDWRDAWNYRVVPATVYMYFAK